MNKLPVALKMIGGVMFVIGFFLIFLTFVGVYIECQITSGKDSCLSGTLFGGLIIGFSYFVSGWGILRKNRLAWLSSIPLVAMLYWSFSQLLGNVVHGGFVSLSYVLLALAPFLIHLGLFFVIVAYRDLYGFKKKTEIT